MRVRGADRGGWSSLPASLHSAASQPAALRPSLFNKFLGECTMERAVLRQVRDRQYQELPCKVIIFEILKNSAV